MQIELKEGEMFKDALREVLSRLLSSRTGAIGLSSMQRQEIREIVSVLSGLEFHSVGTALRVEGARLGIGLIHVSAGEPVQYILVVWNSGQVQVIDPHKQAIDLGLSV